jgi:morphogenesis family protein
MTWDGDISRMGKLADRLHDLAGVPSRASQKIAFRLNDLLLEEFEKGEDPYGSPWQSLAPATVARGRRAPPLTDTSAMKDSLYVKPMAPAGVAMTIKNPPAAPHQTGWKGRQGSGPARPIFPARGELPIAWSTVIKDEVTREFAR